MKKKFIIKLIYPFALVFVLIYAFQLIQLELIPYINATTVSGLSYDASDPNSYNLKFNFSEPYTGTNEYGLFIEDINGNDKPDLIVGNWGTGFGGTESGSVFIIYDNLFSEIAGTGNNIDLSDPNNYNIRFDGATAGDEISDGGVSAGDIDGDGMPDLLITSWAGFNGANSGSLYIIYNTLFADIEGVGNVLSLTSDQNFNIRIDGAGAGQVFTYTNPPLVVDLNNNGRNDLVVSQGWFTRKVFIFFDSLLETHSGVGQIFNISDPDNYSICLDATTAASAFGARSLVADDINQDGKPDLIIGASGADYNSRTNSGSLYLIDNEIISGYIDPGTNLDMSNPINFTVRYDGAEIEQGLGGSGQNVIGDLDNNGQNDLVIGSHYADNNLRTNSGSVYVIYDSLLTNNYNAGPGNIVDMVDTSTWHARFDGARANDTLGWGGLASVIDYNNNQQNDLMIGANGSDAGGKIDTGSYYMLIDNKLPSNTQAGQTIDLLTNSNYSFEYYGASSERMGVNAQSFIIDINGDGTKDLIMNRRVPSGLMIVYNFPHTIAPDTIASPTSESSFEITGSILAPNSVTNIAGVQYSLNDPSFEGGKIGWVDCSASDGEFNSTTENYTCQLSELTEGDHAVYIRAIDTNNSYTPESNYSQQSFTIDESAPSVSSTTTSPSTVDVTISWTTDEPASSQVEYGLTSEYGHLTTEEDTAPRVTSHSLTINGLLSCTTYHYRVISRDSANNEIISDDSMFTTTGCTGNSPVVIQDKTEVASSSGASISLISNNSGLTITVPAGTFTVPAFIQLKKLNGQIVTQNAPFPRGKVVPASLIYDLKAYSDITTEITLFNHPVYITFSYTDGDLRNVTREDSLNVYTYSQESWIKVEGCSRNTGANNMACPLSHFSTYVLLGDSISPPSTTKAPSCGDDTPVGSPDLFEIRTSNTSASIFFTPVAKHVNKYYIAYGTTGMPYQHGVEFTPPYNDGVISYTINDLNPNTTYYFTVRAGNGCAPGNWSQTMEATTTKNLLQKKSWYWYK